MVIGTLSDAIKKLIELELQNIGNPIACGKELIYNGYLPETGEIVIPRLGDLIQSLEIETDATIISAYILVNVNDSVMHPLLQKYKLSVLNANKNVKCYNLFCDYEINLIRPYQVTKLLIITGDSNNCAKNNMTTVYANYSFVDTDSRRKLIESK